MTAFLLAAAVSAAQLARIDSVVAESIAKGELPGAVVLVERRGTVRLRRAWGSRAVLPAIETMSADTVFDVASLTKAVATAPSVMILVEEGKIRLSDPVVRYSPEFGAGGGGRDRVTVEHLLTHRAGFPPDDPLELYTGTPEEIFARKYARPLETPPGAEFVYSDVDYEVLGELVRRVSGKRLDAFAAERIFRPLGMKDTSFLPLSPPSPIPVGRIAPTEKRGDHWMRGEVHDPRAYAL
ncbi:MAG: serine hydrolase domain-containing protein, partial [Thermoanaerobaculia bacterium]